jgi:hypothetical protein
MSRFEFMNNYPCYANVHASWVYLVTEQGVEIDK